jgi:hypothetical protein
MLLLVTAEDETVVGDRPDQQGRRNGSQQQARDVQLALGVTERRESCGERRESRNPKSTWTPRPATRSSCSSSARLRSSRAASDSSRGSSDVMDATPGARGQPQLAALPTQIAPFLRYKSGAPVSDHMSSA